MISDSNSNASIPMASSNPKDFAKKKKANRLAKLKQYKLDARRQQWLSQVKNKSGGCKEELVFSKSMYDPPSVRMEKENGRATEKLAPAPEVKGHNYEVELLIHQYSDSESSPLNSPISCISSISSTLSSNNSRANFSGSSSTSCSSRSSSMGSMSEEDDGGCFDDWEAMADALAATTDQKQREDNPNSRSNLPHPVQHVINTQSETPNLKPGSGVKVVNRAPANCWAWRPDDAYRPQSLPNLMKQRHFHPLTMNVAVVPTSCPICCEDFDFTDSSFLPCMCGFRLCLFCHKRILEEDGRCPGCRKQYESYAIVGEAN